MSRAVINLRSPREIDAIAEGGAIIGALFEEVRERVRPGVTTGELDEFCETFIRDHEGAVPAFKGLYGFPGAVCISVNEEIVHGIPSPTRILESGDIVTVDMGVRLNGWYTDSARTFGVGEIASDSRRLLDVTSRALDAAVAAAIPGNHVGDLGAAVMKVVEGTGFGIVRDLVGHGVGRELHEEPQIPNVGRAGYGPVLRAGMILAIEPMISLGTDRIRTLEDDWTVVTTDGSRSAHFEHTVAVTDDGPRVLTMAPQGAAPASREEDAGGVLK